jgi:hypothetical protein
MRTTLLALAAAAAFAVPAAANATMVFTGSGSKNLAPFTLHHGATLTWRDAGLGILGPEFIVWNNDPSGPLPGISSNAASGSSYLAPGHSAIQILALGNWRITIR